MPTVVYGIWNTVRSQWLALGGRVYSTTYRHEADAQKLYMGSVDPRGGYEVRRMDGKPIRATGPSETK